jgi:hypothetical protein
MYQIDRKSGTFGYVERSLIKYVSLNTLLIYKSQFASLSATPYLYINISSSIDYTSTSYLPFYTCIYRTPM